MGVGTCNHHTRWQGVGELGEADRGWVIFKTVKFVCHFDPQKTNRFDSFVLDRLVTFAYNVENVYEKALFIYRKILFFLQIYPGGRKRKELF